MDERRPSDPTRTIARPKEKTDAMASVSGRIRMPAIALRAVSFRYRGAPADALAGFEGRSPEALSGGEKQRLAIAAALALDPRVLVLDEPLTDLDPVGKADVMRVLRELRAEGRTIVLVEHETEELACADRVVLLD